MDDFEENVYWYCDKCEEEIYTSENSDKCPICESENIELV